MEKEKRTGPAESPPPPETEAERPYEDRVREMVEFIEGGLMALAEAGTRAIDEKDEALARQRFASACSLAQTAAALCGLFPEVPACRDYLAGAKDGLIRRIEQTAALLHPRGRAS